MATKKQEQEQELTYVDPYLARRLARNSTYVDDKPFADGVYSRGVYKMDEIKAVYPLDPRTGLPVTDLGRITDLSLTPNERERIMSRLNSLPGGYMPKELSDEELYKLLPPRHYMHDDVDIQSWRDYLSKEVFPEFSKSVQNALSDVGENMQPAEYEENN